MMLIIGANGYLGSELMKIFPESLHPSRSELNVTNKENVEAYIAKHKPSIVINLAALSTIRECEENKELAWQTNYLGMVNVIEACKKYCNDALLVYMSATGVFYGDKGDYTEDDLPYPINYYGLTKLLAEIALQSSSLQRWLIVRANCVHTGRWHYPRAFVDRYGRYLLANDVAKAIKDVIERGMTGIVHLCGDKKMSLFEAVKKTTPDVQPMTMDEYEGPPIPIDMSITSKRLPPYKMSES